MAIQQELNLLAVTCSISTIVLSSFSSSVFAQANNSTTDSSQNPEQINVDIESRFDPVSLTYRLLPVIAIAAAVVGFILWKQWHNRP